MDLLLNTEDRIKVLHKLAKKCVCVSNWRSSREYLWILAARNRFGENIFRKAVRTDKTGILRVIYNDVHNVGMKI